MAPHDDPDKHDPGLAHDLPTLLSRRRALGLMGGAGLAGALAAFGVSQFTDDKQGARNPYFDVRDYGAAGDGTTDDTTAIRAAIAAAMPVSGTVFLPHGTYGISAELQLLGVDRSVTLIGEGQESSVVKALTSTSRISWGGAPAGVGGGGQTIFGRPSLSHGWMFDGNLIATQGITVGFAGYGTWQNIHVKRVNGDGWTVFPQNCIFTACVSYDCAGNGWTLDYGIQACEFIGCHGYFNDGWDFQIRQSGGAGWGASAQPQGLRFVSGICEQSGSPSFGGSGVGLGGVHIREGLDITFERFDLVSDGSKGSLVLTPSTTNGHVGRIVVRDCRVAKIHLDAVSGGVAQPMGGSNEPLLLTGWNMITSIVNGSTSHIYADSFGKLGSYTTEGTGAAKSLRRGRRSQ